MSKWMVDIKGKCDVSEETMKEVLLSESLSSDSVKEFVSSLSNITDVINNWIKENGYESSDCGGGVGGFHIGVPFDDVIKAAMYAMRLSERFSNLIASGLVWVQIKTWTTKDWIK